MTAEQIAMVLVYVVVGLLCVAAIGCFIGAAVIEWRPKYRRVTDETPLDGLEDTRYLIERATRKHA